MRLQLGGIKMNKLNVKFQGWRMNYAQNTALACLLDMWSIGD